MIRGAGGLGALTNRLCHATVPPTPVAGVAGSISDGGTVDAAGAGSHRKSRSRRARGMLDVACGVGAAPGGGWRCGGVGAPGKRFSSGLFTVAIFHIGSNRSQFHRTVISDDHARRLIHDFYAIVPLYHARRLNDDYLAPDNHAPEEGQVRPARGGYRRSGLSRRIGQWGRGCIHQVGARSRLFSYLGAGRNHPYFRDVSRLDCQWVHHVYGLPTARSELLLFRHGQSYPPWREGKHQQHVARIVA